MTARRSEAGREALLAQLEYLLVEVEALRPLLAELPAGILEARPLDEPSILDAFASIAARDVDIVARVDPGAEPPSAGGSGASVASTLDHVHGARELLLAALRATAPERWGEPMVVGDGSALTLIEMVQLAIRQDLETLRAMGDRLRSARLGDQPRPGLM